MEKNVLNTDLTGKVAVVTGASGTLCSIFAKALARAGAKVALLGRNMDKLKELADEIEAEGGTAKGYTCNVMNKANCLQVAEDVLADFGPCDILVNGAGGNNARANTDKEYFEMADLESDTVTFFDLDESGVEMVFNLNFIGTLLPTQAFARQMVGREGCNILNISSMNAYLPLTKIPAYSGSKAAVTNFTQWLAVHFSKVGIRVNAIAPGFFASEQNAKLLFNEDGTPTDRTKKILAATPMGHFGDSEKDLVGALLFLLNNEAAGFITGICLPVDGGSQPIPACNKHCKIYKNHPCLPVQQPGGTGVVFSTGLNKRLPQPGGSLYAENGFLWGHFFGCFLRHASATATAAHASTASGQTEASATTSCCKPFTKLPQPETRAVPMREKKPSSAGV